MRKRKQYVYFLKASKSKAMEKWGGELIQMEKK